MQPGSFTTMFLVMSIFLNSSIDFSRNQSKEQKSISSLIDGKKIDNQKIDFTTNRPLPVPFFGFSTFTVILISHHVKKTKNRMSS